MTGEYTQIVEIIAPSEAVAGETVLLTIRVRSLFTSPMGIMVGGALDYGISPWPTIDCHYPDNQAIVGPGDTHSFSCDFVMPDSDVTVHAYSYWYGSDSAWHLDDEATKNISLLAVVKPTFSDFKIRKYDSVIA